LIQILPIKNIPKIWISKKKLSLTTYEIFYKQPNSILIKSDNLIFKFCKIQKPKDLIRKYFFSQAKREFYGAKILNSIDIKTPKPINYAISLNPFSKIESLYVMEYLKNSIEVSKIINEEILNLVIIDLQKMIKNRIIFKDLRFHNILYKENSIYWIDTDIKIIKDPQEYKTLFIKSLQKLTKNDKIKEKILQSLF